MHLIITEQLIFKGAAYQQQHCKKVEAHYSSKLSKLLEDICPANMRTGCFLFKVSFEDLKGFDGIF